ncbi:MAG: RluA family pseudouridine synthase [Roseburia sp.]
MKRIFSYEITEKDNEKTIEKFLKEKGYSHAVLVHLKKTPDSILQNGTWEYFSSKLKQGESLVVTLLEEDSSEHIIPVSHPFEIIYEDEDILVINKPADMPIHPSIHNFDNTLANAVAYYFQEKGINYTFRCMNRLDRDTTGLTILAKHMLSAAILNKAVANREVKREYLAIVAGTPDESGTINAPIARKDGSAIEREVNFETGETAITHYHRLASSDDCSLISLHLETGRTHQIRVHMKYIGHPLFGDFLYYPDFSKINRQTLHSYRLEFRHPITGEPLSFTAPLPDDMKRFCPALIEKAVLPDS